MLGEIKSLSYGHMSGKRQTWNPNTFPPTPKLTATLLNCNTLLIATAFLSDIGLSFMFTALPSPSKNICIFNSDHVNFIN